MTIEVTYELEMGCEAGLTQHPVGIPADGKNLTDFNTVVLVELHSCGCLFDGALVDDRLAVVLAGVLEFRDVEESIGRGIEAGLPDKGRK